MALMISDDCVACGTCLDECPNEAIKEDDPIYEIDPELCTECVGYYSGYYDGWQYGIEITYLLTHTY